MNLNDMAADYLSIVPPLRTFRVYVESHVDSEPIYVAAHTYAPDGKTVKFYVYKAEQVAGETTLVAYAVRALRYWLDVEDVSEEVRISAGSKSLN